MPTVLKKVYDTPESMDTQTIILDLIDSFKALIENNDQMQRSLTRISANLDKQQLVLLQMQDPNLCGSIEYDNAVVPTHSDVVESDPTDSATELPITDCGVKFPSKIHLQQPPLNVVVHCDSILHISTDPIQVSPTPPTTTTLCATQDTIGGFVNFLADSGSKFGAAWLGVTFGFDPGTIMMIDSISYHSDSRFHVQVPPQTTRIVSDMGINHCYTCNYDHLIADPGSNFATALRKMELGSEMFAYIRATTLESPNSFLDLTPVVPAQALQNSKPPNWVLWTAQLAVIYQSKKQNNYVQTVSGVHKYTPNNVVLKFQLLDNRLGRKGGTNSLISFMVKVAKPDRELHNFINVPCLAFGKFAGHGVVDVQPRVNQRLGTETSGENANGKHKQHNSNFTNGTDSIQSSKCKVGSFVRREFFVKYSSGGSISKSNFNIGSSSTFRPNEISTSPNENDVCGISDKLITATTAYVQETTSLKLIPRPFELVEVLICMNKEVHTQFLKMKSLLVVSDGQNVEFELARGGKPFTVPLMVQDLHSRPPTYLLEVSGVVLCLVLYDNNIIKPKANSLVSASSFITNIAANPLTSLSFALRSCVMILEGEVEFFGGVMVSLDALYAATASLGIDWQFFYSYSSATTHELILNCITHDAKSTKGIYPTMLESENSLDIAKAEDALYLSSTQPICEQVLHNVALISSQTFTLKALRIGFAVTVNFQWKPPWGSFNSVFCYAFSTWAYPPTTFKPCAFSVLKFLTNFLFAPSLNDATVSLKNCIKIEKLQDPISLVTEILQLCFAETLVTLYKNSIDELLSKAAAQKLRGHVGTTVSVKVHNGKKLAVDSSFRVVRIPHELIDFSPISSAIIPHRTPDGHVSKIGYVTLLAFSQNVAADMGSANDEFVKVIEHRVYTSELGRKDIFSWDDANHLLEPFIVYHLEDKVVLKGGSNVMNLIPNQSAQPSSPVQEAQSINQNSGKGCVAGYKQWMERTRAYMNVVRMLLASPSHLQI